MAFNVEEIKQQLSLGGARPSLFNVLLTPPTGGLGLSSLAVAKVPFLVSAASIPESAVGTVLIPYYGRKVKFQGDRTFQPWTVTVLNDEDFLIRNFLEQWSDQINSLQTNLRTFTTSSPLLAEGTAVVQQLSKTGLPLRQYSFVGIWPALVNPIPLDWNATDQIESFTVTFEYDYYRVGPSITGQIND